MADYVNVAEAFKSGYEATGKVREDIESKDILRKAFEGTEKETDEDSGKTRVDPFKVNTLAAQMALKSGNAQMAEKFEKRAAESKTSSLDMQIKDLNVQQAKLEGLEQKLQMIDNSEQATNEVMRSDLPTQQKLQLIDRLKKIGNNKEEFDKFKPCLNQLNKKGVHFSMKPLTVLLVENTGVEPVNGTPQAPAFGHLGNTTM